LVWGRGKAFEQVGFSVSRRLFLECLARTGREVAALPYREWRLAILAMLQEVEKDAAEEGKEEAFGSLLFELKQDLQARVSLGYW
jgi:hypothetical protein